MPQFTYQAYDSSGAKVDGQLEAKNEQFALIELKKQGMLPFELKEFADSGHSLFSFGLTVSLADLEFLTAELSLLLGSGVRIDKGIDIIRKTKAKPALAKLLAEISQSLKRGSSLSCALAEHPEAFDALYVNLVELGEASGQLSDIFDGLAKDLKFRRDLQRKILQSLTYPAVIFFVCSLCVLFIFNFIVPKMSSLFADAENLPWYTEMILGVSEWLQAYQGYLGLLVIILGFGLSFIWKDKGFQTKWQSFLLKLPVVKGSIYTAERIRFNSGLAMMLQAGVPIDRALELSAGNIKNLILQKEMHIVRQKIKRGSALAPALKQTSLYPDFYVSLLEVGEESGNLAKVFNEIASRSRQDFEEWTQKLTTLIEPMLILLMGGIVGGVVVVMLMSMVSVNDIGI